MNREIINTDSAPAAVGPYSQAVRTGTLVFCSGQIALVPGTAVLISDSIEAQTRQCIKNLEAVLIEAGSSLGQAVKIQIFLTDMGNFAPMNAVYREFFDSDCPARFCVAVRELPLGALVEIDAVGICS